MQTKRLFSKAIMFLAIMLIGMNGYAKTNLTMTVWGGNHDKKTYGERLALAEKMFPDIQINLVIIPKDYDQKLQTMLLGGSAPDIVQMAEGIHGYSGRDLLLPLDDMIQANNIDLEAQFGKSLPAIYARNGHQYAIPDRGGAMVVYYNKVFFKEAGLEPPNLLWKWDTFLDAAQRLTKTEGGKTQVFGFAAGDWWPWWMAFIYQNGGKILDDNGKVVFKSKETREALEFYHDLMYKYKVAPTPKDYADLGNAGPDQLFAQGKTAMEMTGFWNIGSLKNVKGLDWDIAPVWGQKENATFAFGSALAIPKASKHKKEAFEVIQFLTSTEGQFPIIKNAQDVPANLESMANSIFQETPYLENPIDMGVFEKSANIIRRPPIVPQWNEIRKTIGDQLSVYFLNKQDLDTTMDKVQKRLERVMR